MHNIIHREIASGLVFYFRKISRGGRKKEKFFADFLKIEKKTFYLESERKKKVNSSYTFFWSKLPILL
jgi:hypothetical protein